MSTLADELLNDFEDSGSEQGEDNHDFLDGHDNEPQEQNGVRNDRSSTVGRSQSPGMEIDGDEEEAMENAEEEVEARIAGADGLDDEDDTKAKVEKMKLGTVSDVRNVAGLMKTLQPVLDVSPPP